jgi:hypothetical protein
MLEKTRRAARRVLNPPRFSQSELFQQLEPKEQGCKYPTVADRLRVGQYRNSEELPAPEAASS